MFGCIGCVGGGVCEGWLLGWWLFLGERGVFGGIEGVL